MVSRIIKNLLVIGGANGIGKEALSFFKKKDYRILVLDIENEKKIKDISYLKFDISKIQDHKKVLQAINKKTITQYGIINNKSFIVLLMSIRSPIVVLLFYIS